MQRGRVLAMLAPAHRLAARLAAEGEQNNAWGMGPWKPKRC
jgi:hypothetical protein